MMRGRGRGQPPAPVKIEGAQLATIVAQLKQVPENNTCFECQRGNPQWASVPLGILICLECAGKHRAIGTHLSFVRSLTIDSWSPKQIAGMKLGGNANAHEFFDKYNILDIPDLSRKYSQLAACAYRDKIDTVSDGRPWTDPTDEQLRSKYASMNMGFSLPASSVSPKPSPNSSSRGRPSPGNSGGAYVAPESYNKYNGSSSISSDDFFGRSSPLVSSQTDFRYHNSSNAYSTQSRQGGATANQSLLAGGGGRDYDSPAGFSQSSGRGRATRGRPPRGGPRGRARGSPRPGRGGGVRDPNTNSNPESASTNPESVETPAVASSGFEDLLDDGWGGELPNDGWGGELTNVNNESTQQTKEEEPNSTSDATTAAPAIDIWDFTSAAEVSCPAQHDPQPQPADVSVN